MREAVRRCTEIRVAGAFAEARAIDPALRVLDPHADREGFSLQMHAAPVEHLEGGAGAVADREHDMIGLEEAAVVQVQAAQFLAPVGQAFELEIVDARFPAIFAAECLDRRPHALDHGDEAEGADMRVRLPQDVVGRTGFHELLQHLAAEKARILDPAIELAVGEGARAALAELDVRIRIELAPAPKAPSVLRALAHHLAAVEDDRPEAHLREDQPREQPARPGADHHGPEAAIVLRRLRHELVGHVGCRFKVLVAREARQHRGLVGQLDIDRVDQLDGVASPRVVAAAIDAVALQLRGGDAETLCDGLGHRLGRVVERQIESG
jgi:hypothetical protein